MSVRPLVLVLLAGCDVVWGIKRVPDAGPLVTAVDAPADVTIDTPPETIFFVQSGANGAVATNTTTIDIMLPNPVRAGDLLVVFVTWANTTNVTVSVKDLALNTFQPIGPIATYMNLRQQGFFVENALPKTTDKITATFNTPVFASDMRIVEYSGIATLGSPDGHLTFSNTGNLLSGTLPTTHAHDLVLASTMVVNAAAPGAESTQRVYYFASGNLIEDQFTWVAGDHTLTAGEAPPGDWLFDIAAFKAQ
jgi:hypothetical protein